MNVTIDVTSDEAEEILIALSHRTKQNGIRGTEQSLRIFQLGEKLCDSFTGWFGWSTAGGGVFAHHCKNDIRVNVIAKNRW